MGRGTEDDRPDRSGVVMDNLPLPELGKVFVLFEAAQGGLEGSLASFEVHEHLLAEEPILVLPLEGDNILQLPESALGSGLAVYLSINGRRTKIKYNKKVPQ